MGEAGPGPSRPSPRATARPTGRLGPVAALASALVAVLALLSPAAAEVAPPPTTTVPTSSSTTTTTRPTTTTIPASSTTTTTTTAPTTTTPTTAAPAPSSTDTTVETTPGTAPDGATAPDPGSLIDLAANPELGELPPGELDLIAQYLQVKQEARDLADRISALNQGLTDAQNELAAAQAKVTQADAAAAVAGRKVKAAELDLARQRADLRKHAVAAYINGGSEADTAGVLLHGGSVDDLTRSIAYADAVVRDEQDLVDRTAVAHHRADGANDDAQQRASAATHARDEVAARNDELNRKRDELIATQQQMILNAERERSVLSTAAQHRLAVDEQLAGQARLSDGISGTLAARQAGQQLPALTDGIFLSPLPNPRISSPFGARVDPLYGGIRGHPGIDMVAPTGTPIRAPADGTVVTAGWIDGYGNCTIIDHGNGLATLYGHQSALLVKDGDVVRRGQTIGLVGSTGYSTGPHLHWEVRVMGRVVNPVPYLGQLT